VTLRLPEQVVVIDSWPLVNAMVAQRLDHFAPL